MAGSTVGFASLTLDTTLSTIDVTEQIDLRLPDADTVLRIVQRTRTTFDRSLGLLGVVVSRSQSGERTEIRATRLGDSATSWQAGPEGRPGRADTIPTRPGTAAPPSALPLLVVALRSPRIGMLRKVDLLDPLRRRRVQVDVAVLADSTLVVPDSAAVNPETGIWESNRYDTLRAWQIRRQGDGPPVTLWVDEDGLPVMGELLPGLVAERQPFEIATNAYRQAFASGARGDARSPASATLVSRPPAIQSMLVRLARVEQDTAGWARAELSGGSQWLSADTLFLSRHRHHGPQRRPVGNNRGARAGQRPRGARSGRADCRWRNGPAKEGGTARCLGGGGGEVGPESGDPQQSPCTPDPEG